MRGERGRGRRRNFAEIRGGYAGAGGLLLVGLLMLLAPYASAVSPTVYLTKPYSGTAYTSAVASVSGLSCGGTGALAFTAPYFQPNHGRGGVGQLADSNPCASYVYETHQITTQFGLNSSTFVPSTNVAKDYFHFRWSMTYYLYVSTAWGGGNNSSYAYASVSVGAWLYDLTTHTSTTGRFYYYNYTYLFDQSSTISLTLYKIAVALTFHSPLSTTDTYEFQTLVTSETYAETYGPLGAGDTAYAQVAFPGSGPSGILSWVYY